MALLCTFSEKLRNALQKRRHTPAFCFVCPAYAWNTWSVPASLSLLWAHPRVCGEDYTRRTNYGKYIGSPPRMRGKLTKQMQTLGQDRLTPAHAGKIASAYRSCTHRQAHPRVCGEYNNNSRGPGLCLGSPPRMRGIH